MGYQSLLEAIYSRLLFLVVWGELSPLNLTQSVIRVNFFFGNSSPPTSIPIYEIIFRPAVRPRYATHGLPLRIRKNCQVWHWVWENIAKPNTVAMRNHGFISDRFPSLWRNLKWYVRLPLQTIKSRLYHTSRQSPRVLEWSSDIVNAPSTKSSTIHSLQAAKTNQKQWSRVDSLKRGLLSLWSSQNTTWISKIHWINTLYHCFATA